MIVQQFLLWARGAPAAHRAEAVMGLAEAFLQGELPPDDRRDAQTALTAMLDDPSPMVRLAMAEALADAPEAPPHVIIALANDRSEIASVVLARSPVLLDADLIDCAALGDEPTQRAIASRPYLSVATAAALAEIAAAGALAALAANPGAEITEASLWRMVERHRSDPALRETLLRRPHLPLDLRHAIALASSDQLSAFVRESGFGAGRTERAFNDARDRATVAMALTATADDVARLVTYLRRTGQLTPALILRALLSRGIAFVEAAFAELTRLPLKRVAGLLQDQRGAGFQALYDRAKLPPRLKPAFEAAASAVREIGGDTSGEGMRLSAAMIDHVLYVCAGVSMGESGQLIALLRRYEAEAARDAARQAVGELAGAVAATLALEYLPAEPNEDGNGPVQDAA